MPQTYEQSSTHSARSHDEILQMGAALADFHLNHRATLGEKAPLSRQERQQLVKILPDYSLKFVDQPRPAAKIQPKVTVH